MSERETEKKTDTLDANGEFKFLLGAMMSVPRKHAESFPNGPRVQQPEPTSKKKNGGEAKRTVRDGEYRRKSPIHGSVGFQGQGWASRPVGSGNGEDRIETGLLPGRVDPERRCQMAEDRATYPPPLLALLPKLLHPCRRGLSEPLSVQAAEALVDRERLAGKPGLGPMWDDKWEDGMSRWQEVKRSA